MSAVKELERVDDARIGGEVVLEGIARMARELRKEGELTGAVR